MADPEEYPYVADINPHGYYTTSYACAWAIANGFKSLVDELGGNEFDVYSNVK